VTPNLEKVLTNLNPISEEFLQDEILSKAKIYDFLPIAYNSQIIVEKAKS
jgi:hypothetical protein